MRVCGVLIVVLMVGCTERPRPLDDPDRWASAACRTRFTIEHQDSPLTELRELGGGRDDFQDRFPAAEIDPVAQRSVSATAKLRLEGQPIAWFSHTLDAVVLDGAAFAPLRRADATKSEIGVRQVVGRVVPRARQALGDRAVLELLLRIDAIHTYWHLGADLCLTEEHSAKGVYSAELKGVHHAIITRRSGRSHTEEAHLTFSVEIDAESEVSVVGVAKEPNQS